MPKDIQTTTGGGKVSKNAVDTGKKTGEANKQNDLELCKAASFGFGLKQNWDVECADLKRKWEQLFCNSGGLEMKFLGKSVAGKQVELGIDAAGSSFQGSADFSMKNDDKSGQGETERVEGNSESDKSSGGSTTDGGGDGRSFKHLGLFIIHGLSN